MRSIHLLLFLWPHVPSTWALHDYEHHDDWEKCSHGDWDPASKSCKCWDHWTSAGITDTIDFLEGKCHQFQCESNQHCRDVLKIDSAECPVKGWNCHCGWKYAFMDGWKGWDPMMNDRTEGLDGECMGVMYTIAMYAWKGLYWLIWVWVPFVLFAVLLLPFGRKRAVCDHHWPSLWNFVRRLFGCPIQCEGGCVMSHVYTLDTFKDDVAWSIFMLELMVWTYIFCGAVLLTLAGICSIVVWIAILVILVVFAIAGICLACMGCGEGGCEMGNGEHFNCCGLFGEGSPTEAAGAQACDCCCNACETSAADGTIGEQMFFWGGPFPHSYYWGFGPYYGSGQDDCCCCCNPRNRVCSFICKPVASVLFVFPAIPENMWGGLVGYFCFGTHHMTPAERIYQGGNCLIDLLMFRRSTDLHGDDQWRARVHDFLAGDEDNDNVVPGPQNSAAPALASAQLPLTADGNRIVPIPGSRHCHAVMVERAFELEQDRAWPSSFDDYRKNCCWICQNDCDEWDLWLSCRHMFCKTCSTTMLKRRMPCPLCRVSSCTVLRGEKYQGTPSNSGCTSEHALASNPGQNQEQPESTRQQSTPAVSTPAVSTPAVSTRAVGTPAVSTPGRPSHQLGRGYTMMQRSPAE